MNEQLALDSPQNKTQVEGPVECLGITFENDEKRRAYFLEKLREKLKDPEFRRIEGFPIGSDEDILAMSDSPYYTACPNPFLGDFIQCFQKRDENNYKREPFTADVSEGKSGAIYSAHSYHTKVPHRAIMRYILHYTSPGNIVFDGFCGTGMTGVAAALCADRPTLQSLGYTVEPDGSVWEGKERISQIGLRRAILNDLSPVASFIAYNYNVPVNTDQFQHEAHRLLDLFDEQYGWMYRTHHPVTNQTGRINYVVWSDVFLCNYCQGELIFWEHAVDEGEVKDQIQCPHCNASVSKGSLDRMKTTVLDLTLGKPVEKAVRRPAVINYSVEAERFEKEPDENDLAILRRVEREPIPGWYPTRRIDEDIDLWYERDYRSLGIFSVDAFYQKRALIMVSFFYDEIAKYQGRLRGFLWFWFQSVLMGFSLLNRYLKNAFSQVNRILSGTLYVGAMHSEVSPWYALEGKIGRLKAFGFLRPETAIVATTSTVLLSLPDASIDYIFTDPPFGSNIIYSDLSILWESWLRLSTNTAQESVVHRRKKKDAFTLEHYADLMAACFQKMYRALKPGRWMTVEFHNSKNSVWNVIQEALLRAGFVVADVRTLNKQVGTFKQVTAAGAVKQDLVISAYKPTEQLEKRFSLDAGTEEGVWDFITNHLQQLPIIVTTNNQVEVIAERQGYLLFDRMVAFHVQRGFTVPLSASGFYQGLAQRFTERDGMYFLPEQAAEYNRKRMTVKEVLQLDLFVTDETSAIQWLKQQLTKKPQTFQDLHPQFLREIGGWQKHEKPLELSELLEENFLRFNGTGEVPSQIHSYLSSNFKELRNRPKDDPALHAKAKDRWYVPDPNKAGDLEKLRERTLLHEFWAYLPPGYKPAQPESQAGFIPGLESKSAPIPQGKKFKVIRMEAVRAGFKYCYQSRDYRTIIAVARRIPESILQEDQKLYMWYDLACTRSGEEP